MEETNEKVVKTKEIDEKAIKIEHGVQGLTPENLVELWHSVGWVYGSALEPERLYNAMLKASNVYTAWVDNNLIGLCSAIDDGLNAWITYMVVTEEYQNQKIGSQLLSKMMWEYDAYRIFVQTLNAKHFYKQHGFKERGHSMKLDLQLPYIEHNKMAK